MTEYSKDDIEILIATMDRSDLMFLENIFNKSLTEISENVLIVNQSLNIELTSSRENIRVINDKGYGLSRSRNIAIENSRRPVLWILDDDCEIIQDTIEKLVIAHNSFEEAIVTFQTQRREDDDPFWEYPDSSRLLSKIELRNVLSPEITFKKNQFAQADLQFDKRFGLGAQFQDSENFILFQDALSLNMQIRFVPEYIVIHDAVTSSDEADSNRLIYARGALAGRENTLKAVYLNYKYTFFLWRKGFVRSFNTLLEKHTLFKKGIEDYRHS
ncbi:MAG: glycosyltransferase [Nonlabens sp.]